MRVAAAWRRVTRFFDHPQPRLALGGTIALAVVGNQPFYPFYVAYAAGAWVGPAFATWLSTPLFLLAPALARQDPDRGRALLLTAATGNTVVSALALGPASGVEMFYVPCLVLAAAIVPAGRRLGPLAACGAVAAAGLALARIVSPWAVLTPAQDRSLGVMHGVSAACVTGLILILAYRLAGARSPPATSLPL